MPPQKSNSRPKAKLPWQQLIEDSKKYGIQLARDIKNYVAWAFQRLFGLAQGWEKHRDIVRNNYELGCKHLALGNIRDAILRFKMVTWLAPKHADGWYRLGCAYMADGKPKLAKDALARSLQLKPGNPDAARLMAIASGEKPPAAASDIRIREGVAADAEAMAALHKQSFPNYWKHEAFTDFFSVRGTYALIAEAPRPVAMIVYRVLYEQADIITLAVHPDYRRRGIARDLLKRALDHIAASGAEKIFLDVEDGNQDALQLYEKYGFFVIDRRKQYYRQQDGTFTDALVMSRKLG